MTTAIDQANAEQRAASNPLASAFVAASAGSGKTKLLTDRLLRLMLSGTRPDRILCLTYTKAAAAEMAIRLNRRLGKWVAQPDNNLNAELQSLDLPPNAATRAIARKLFAEVLDLPGGMKIGTIHAFCQSILRRFPLEAHLSPHFTLEDEHLAAARLRESRELILADDKQRDNIFALAAEANEQDFSSLTAKFAASEYNLSKFLLTSRDAFYSPTSLRAKRGNPTANPSAPGDAGHYPPEALAALQRAALAAPDHTSNEILRRAVTWPHEATLKTHIRHVSQSGTPSGREWATNLLSWLSQTPESRIASWPQWLDLLLTKSEDPRSIQPKFGKAMAAYHDHLNTAFSLEQSRIIEVQDSLRAARLAALNQHLFALIHPILATDTAQKTLAATLTYAGLITHTQNLLQNPDDVAWILYKLDGGIDHLLLDEVQDTAPAQWDITNAIATEFFAGSGARETTRTIFAVGDPKQSIFSFQGADLTSFETNRQKFQTAVTAANQTFLNGNLSVSFRSSAPILTLVDATFAEGPATEGVTPPQTLHHIVSRTGQAGAVTLWPLTIATPPSPILPWAIPDAYESTQSAKTALAKSIAAHIKQSLDSGRKLPSRNRPVTPGDFLILVRHRDELITAITAACKAADIPIAGADRLILTHQQAVQDILALCDALLLPEDDLAFAHYLASPLGGLSDDSLQLLALNRKSPLAFTLFNRHTERGDWSEANQLFQTLLPQVDFVSPQALLAKILHPLGGRAKLLQRLGPDAAEPIDELLTEALTHAAAAPASLQSFIHTLRQSGASIKREAEAAGDVVRIMTIHGAKGLQAPIVILPDTTSLPNPRESLFWLDIPQQGGKIPIYCPRTSLRSQTVTQAATANRAADIAEYNRLLYVALTRAEDELIITGAEGAKALPPNCWYNTLQAAFDRLNIPASPDGTRTLSTPQPAPPDRQDQKSTATTHPLPPWAGAPPTWRATPPATETTRPEPLAPSRNTDDEAKRATTASPIATHLAPLRTARAAALAKGRAIHALLQHLPDLPPAQRPAATTTYLANPALNLTPTAQSQIHSAIIAILENPQLAPLFGPQSRAEAPLAGIVNGAEIGGLVDRVAITGSDIHIADYKTDRSPPATPTEIPTTYLRQLAAYAAILAEIFPNLPIHCTLIWTETATPMQIPPQTLALHAPTPSQPYPTTRKT